MCFVGTIPYLQEALIVLIVVAVALTLFKKERCPCKAEIEALKEELSRLHQEPRTRQ